MRSSNEIYIDYKKAREAAERLESVADQIDRLVRNDMQNTIAELSAGWKCDASNAFAAKQEQAGDNIRSLASTIRSIASDIRADAYRYYKAEMEAIEILSD